MISYIDFGKLIDEGDKDAVAKAFNELEAQQAQEALLGMLPDEQLKKFAEMFGIKDDDGEITGEAEERIDANGDGDTDVIAEDITGDGEADISVAMGDTEEEAKDAVKAAKEETGADEADSTSTGKKKCELEDDERNALHKNILSALSELRF